MNPTSPRIVFCPFDETSARIRSVDFAVFEKPAHRAHWSYDETLAPRRPRKRAALDLATALRALQELARR